MELGESPSFLGTGTSNPETKKSPLGWSHEAIFIGHTRLSYYKYI
jgi:hypothetical protein